MAEIREGIAEAGLCAKQFDEDADDARLNRGATDGARIPWPIDGLCSVENTNANVYWNCPGIVPELSSRGAPPDSVRPGDRRGRLHAIRWQAHGS